jgi:hypothetical protein
MMNERIKQLAEQADKLSIKYANENNVNHVDAFNIVFAELIVRECIGVVESDGLDSPLAIDLFRIKVNEIKEHFGVE